VLIFSELAIVSLALDRLKRLSTQTKFRSAACSSRTVRPSLGLVIVPMSGGTYV
jgi:hypothetical protein